MLVVEECGMDFSAQYGPWAIIAGASEGTGRAYARFLAVKGLSLILIARRQGPLDALATEIAGEYGVECITASIDLGEHDAHRQVIATAGDREVGLFIGNAGADPNGGRFLDRDAAAWTSLVTRNVMTTMLCCHHFAAQMRERRRGGILLSNSYACYGGGQFMACYSASKAFDLCFAESLWSELRPFGVDVLSLIMGMTDTTAFRALLDGKGLPTPAGIARAEDVAAFGLAQLGNGPIQNWGLKDDEPVPGQQSAAARRERVLAIDHGSRAVFGD